MKQQLILHIGDCKTGSTILQTMMDRGDWSCPGARLFSPGRGVHGALARGLGGRPSLYPGRWQSVAKRLVENQWDVAVLSSELFEFSRPQAVRRAVERHFPDHAGSLRVVAYVRPHISRLLSQCAENLKLGHDTGDLADFVTRFVGRGRLNYAERLSGWREAFGERFTVRPFLRDQLYEGDVRRDFLNVILRGRPFALANSGQDDNAALPVADLALMRLLQRRIAEQGEIPVDNRVAFGKQFGRLLRQNSTEAKGEKLALPRAIYDSLYDACRNDAEAFDAAWMDAPCFVPELENARDALVEQAQSLEASDYWSADALRLASAWGDLLLRQMQDETKDFARRLRPG